MSLLLSRDMQNKYFFCYRNVKDLLAQELALCQPFLELQLCIVRSTSRQCFQALEAKKLLLFKVLFDKR